jgi:RNA polymerase II C-terminal domain phosphatase-like 1/2
MSLRNLANKYLSSDPNKMTDLKENGFGSNHNFFGYSGNTRDDMLPVPSTSEESRFMKMEDNNSQKTGGSVAALKELVEVGGQILGKGVALTWEEAKLQVISSFILNKSICFPFVSLVSVP